MSNLIKEIEKLCLCQDFNLFKHFTNSQQFLTHRHFNIINVKKTKVELKKQIKSVYSSMKQTAKSSEDIKYRWLCDQIKVIKLWEKCAVLVKTLHNYHSIVDLNHMIAQLKKVKSASQILALIEHVLLNCNWLTDNLFNLMTDESFVNIVKTMSHLCSQSEDKCHKLNSY